MTDDANDKPRLAEPLPELERHLIHAYLAGAGQDFHTLTLRDDDAARRLLAAASAYASWRLSEIDARLHYIRSLQGRG